MYPDTDSAPIPLDDEHIDRISKRLPSEVIDRYHQLKKWGVPEDTYTYIFSKNLFPVMEKIVKELKIDPKMAGTFIGHHLKYVEGRHDRSPEFSYSQVYDLFRFLKESKLELILAGQMMPVIYEHPKMDFESVLTSIKFRKVDKKDILAMIPFFRKKFKEIGRSQDPRAEKKWIMGELRPVALGNTSLPELSLLIS
jgi:glutamyl-tRNA(Gln) amidotransferase subunit E